MRSILAGCVVTLSLVACGDTNSGGGDDQPGSPDACVGLECDVVDCAKLSKPPTTITGTVFAPNGTLPLYGINVYVPRSDPGPVPAGLQCNRCSDELPGGPVVQTKTDEMGNFRLENIPAGDNVPVVITTGKWRRQIVIPRVESCTEQVIAPTETRLPKNKSEGDIPQIAITTGNADALECLIRKLGVEDAEISTDGGAGRIHLFNGNGANKIGATNMAAATTLWDSAAKLKSYDITIFSCEGGQNADSAGANGKSQAAMDAVKEYADLGGRVFMSHWHNVWIEGATNPDRNRAPAVWPGIATWNDADTTFGNGAAAGQDDTIDEASNPKGSSFASWMTNVMGSPTRGVIPIETSTGKSTLDAVDTSKAERWVYWQDGNTQRPQNFQFTTPNEVSPDARCGKVVFSDMHVSGDSDSRATVAFPGDCSASPLTPQEKALAFMFFDISSCVGSIL